VKEAGKVKKSTVTAVARQGRSLFFGGFSDTRLSGPVPEPEKPGIGSGPKKEEGP